MCLQTTYQLLRSDQNTLGPEGKRQVLRLGLGSKINYPNHSHQLKNLNTSSLLVLFLAETGQSGLLPREVFTVCVLGHETCHSLSVFKNRRRGKDSFCLAVSSTTCSWTQVSIIHVSASLLWNVWNTGVFLVYVCLNHRVRCIQMRYVPLP